MKAEGAETYRGVLLHPFVAALEVWESSRPSVLISQLPVVLRLGDETSAESEFSVPGEVECIYRIVNVDGYYWNIFVAQYAAKRAIRFYLAKFFCELFRIPWGDE